MELKDSVIAGAYRSVGAELPILLLRGNDSQARANGDIDFLVPHAQGNRACLLLASHMQAEGWMLLSFRDIGYLATITLVLITDENKYSIKVDFFSGLEWRGIGTGETSRIFFEKLLPRASAKGQSIELAASVSFLQKCMYAGYLGDRDQRRVAVPTDLLIGWTRELGLHLSKDNIPTGVGRLAQWRLRHQTGKVNSIVARLGWWATVLRKAISSRFGWGFESGLVLSLSGMDGSGKTTQIDFLMDLYSKSGMVMPIQIHFLPSWILLPHQVFRRKKTQANYLRPYSEAPTSSRISELVRVIWYFVSFSIAKFYVISKARMGNVVVMDRSFIDLTVDLPRVKLPHRQLSPFWMKTLTIFGLNLYLDVDPQVAVARKNEIDIEKAKLLKARYLETFKIIDGKVIDANLPAATTQRAIVSLIDEHYSGRLARKVGGAV